MLEVFKSHHFSAEKMNASLPHTLGLAIHSNVSQMAKVPDDASSLSFHFSPSAGCQTQLGQEKRLQQQTQNAKECTWRFCHFTKGYANCIRHKWLSGNSTDSDEEEKGQSQNVPSLLRGINFSSGKTSQAPPAKRQSRKADEDVEDEVMKAIAAQDEEIDIGSEEEPIPPAPNIFEKSAKTKRKAATPRKKGAKAPALPWRKHQSAKRRAKEYALSCTKC